MLLLLSLSLATLLSGCGALMCYFGRQKSRAETASRLRELEQQADRAAAAAAKGDAPPVPPLPAAGRSPADAAALLQRDSLRSPLLQAIPEDESDDASLAPVQRLEELPGCVQQFLARSIRDGRRFKLFTLQQLGQMKLREGGGWKEATAVQTACPLEPAFVWSACASVAPLISVKGCDSFVNGSGHCSWHLWGSVPAASGGGREVDQSLRVRWLAEAACFPQALMPSRFLRWETVKGESHEAEAVLSYGGTTVRAVFTFDRFSRVVRVSTRDFLRRLPNGTFEAGEWEVAYSGHMLFGLSPQGPVMQEEVATHAGIFIPTNMEAAWHLPDGSRWVYAKFTVAKVTGSVAP